MRAVPRRRNPLRPPRPAVFVHPAPTRPPAYASIRRLRCRILEAPAAPSPGTSYRSREQKKRPRWVVFLIRFLQPVPFLVGVGEKCEVASSLHGCGEHTLVFRLGAGDTTGQDFSTVGDKFSEQAKVFVVDGRDLVRRKVARLSSGSTSALFVIHKSSGSFSVANHSWAHPNSKVDLFVHCVHPIVKAALGL